MTMKTKQKADRASDNGALFDHPDLAARLKEEWQELQQQIEAGALDADSSRAEKLTAYAAAGMTQREMAACIPITQQHINCLLRYRRFLTASAVKISEGTFRRYWLQISDKKAVEGQKGYPSNYEIKVFKAIDDMLAAGKKPLRTKRKSSPSALKELRPLTRIRKAVREVYGRLKPTLAQLRHLLGCDRSTFAPSSIAAHAQALEREIKELFRVLADVSEEQ